jgi:hypothetical protein
MPCCGEAERRFDRGYRRYGKAHQYACSLRIRCIATVNRVQLSRPDPEGYNYTHSRPPCRSMYANSINSHKLTEFL